MTGFFCPNRPIDNVYDGSITKKSLTIAINVGQKIPGIIVIKIVRRLDFTDKQNPPRTGFSNKRGDDAS